MFQCARVYSVCLLIDSLARFFVHLSMFNVAKTGSVGLQVIYTWTYYMASSVSGKMNRILRRDWLPEQARWSYLTRSGLPVVSRQINFPESHIINPSMTKLVRSRWLDIATGLVPFFSSLWTSTPSRSINTQKRTWSISSHLDPTLGQ